MLDEARGALEEVIRQRPGFAEGYCQLGLVCHALGRIDEAREALETSLRLRPELAEAEAELGDMRANEASSSRAIALYQQAVGHKPDFVGALDNLAVAQRDAGRLDDAAAACRRAIALDPKCAQALGNLGLVLEDQQQLTAAIACHRDAVRLSPHSAELHNALAAARGAQRRTRGGTGRAGRSHTAGARASSPRISNRGGVLKQLGRYDEAIRQFEQALALDNGALDVRNSLGSALQLAGRPVEARDAYQRIWKSIRTAPTCTRTWAGCWLPKASSTRRYRTTIRVCAPAPACVGAS